MLPRLSTRALGRFTAFNSKISPKFTSKRFLSDSHDDFKPQKHSAGPSGMEEALEMIDRQVKEHDVML